MFLTVQQAEIKDGVSSDKEKTKLANALRRAVNMVSTVRVQLTSAATPDQLWASDVVPEGAVWALDVYAFYRVSAGTAARGRFWRSALFYREPAGSVTQQGASGVVVPDINTNAFMGVQFSLSSNAIFLQVTGDGVSTADWDATITVREVT